MVVALVPLLVTVTDPILSSAMKNEFTTEFAITAAGRVIAIALSVYWIDTFEVQRNIVNAVSLPAVLNTID